MEIFTKYSFKIKYIFLIININIHLICLNYSKKLLNYYYMKRLEKIRTWKRNYEPTNLLTFEDKMNWLAIYDVKKLKGKCSDKILLHEYSRRILKKDICNKILKIYDDPNQINLSDLPEKFVLKTNHGSGFNIIVEDKTKLDLNSAKKNLLDWLKIDYGKTTTEFHYSFINRKAFAEEYIGNDINNYKFLCFHSIPKYVYLSKKIKGKKYRTYFDMNWNKLDFNCVFPPHPTLKFTKPKTFELMKKYANKLSHPFKFARVDLYEYQEKVRLGEITFIPMNSHERCKKREDNIKLAEYLKLF